MLACLHEQVVFRAGLMGVYTQLWSKSEGSLHGCAVSRGIFGPDLNVPCFDVNDCVMTLVPMNGLVERTPYSTYKQIPFEDQWIKPINTWNTLLLSLVVAALGLVEGLPKKKNLQDSILFWIARTDFPVAQCKGEYIHFRCIVMGPCRNCLISDWLYI